MSKDNHAYLTNILSTLRRLRLRRLPLRGLGITVHKNRVLFYFQGNNCYPTTFNVAISLDGLDFSLYRKNLTITNFTFEENINQCLGFNIIKLKNYFLLIYQRQIKGKIDYQTATSSDLLHFVHQQKFLKLTVNPLAIADFKLRNQYLVYLSNQYISLMLTPDFQRLSPLPTVVLRPRPDKFDSGPLQIAYATKSDRGILVIYHSFLTNKNRCLYPVVGAAVFDKEDPSQLLWRSDEPLWTPKEEWQNKQLKFIGMIHFHKRLLAYWQIEKESIYAVSYSSYKIHPHLPVKNISLNLKRAPNNPLIIPKKENTWEAFNTFNPAAIYEDGKVHLVYRAQGYNYVSTLGYATSSDGYKIDYRHPEPIYFPTASFEYTGQNKPTHITHFFSSGGGYGGCEDPRLTKINDRLYMTYVAYDGINPPRVALTSIALADFLNQRWLWEKPVIISPPGIVDKNAVIFPEKIKGKYVIMHRIYPDILIDFVDSLEFDGSQWLNGEYKISPRPNMWDSRKIGAGAPPIKTKDGWLLIYQAVGNQDPGRYKIGVMLLDLQDPTKILHRSIAPILEPTERYENEGFKAGVVYPCGAVVIRNTLFVYYGGADSYVCVATADLNNFLAELKYSEIAKLEPAIINQVNL